MQRLACLAAVSLASLAVGQSPLTTLFSGGNGGNTGGGVYFDLTVTTTITFTQIDLNSTSTASTVGSFDVYLGPPTWVGNATNPALWTPVVNVPVTTAGPNLHTVGVLPTPFALGPGHYGVAIKANNFAHAYTNGNGTNQHYATAEVALDAGGAQNAFLSATAPFSPRVVNAEFRYTLGGTPIAVASWQPFGTGCYGFYTSFYEFWPSSVTVDMGTASGTNSLHLALAGNFYVATVNVAGNAAWFTPTSTALTMGDEANVIQATPFPVLYPSPGGPQISTSFTICSNGYISPGTANTISFNPDPAAFLAGQPRWGNWHDFDPSVATAGNGVFFDVDPSGNTFYVTWLNVPDYGIAGSSNTWQMAFSNNGDVEFRWQSMSQMGGGGWPTLIGWTPGGGALDPASRDLSASTTFTTQAADNAPLIVSMSARPVLGTTPNLVTDNIPAGTGLGVRILSFTQHNPGLPLTAFGMPGCFQYTGLDASVVFVASGPQVSAPFAIPNLPSFNGTLVFGQSATFSSGFNTLGVITSNGLRLLVGSL